jgi:hypothetical protein
MAKKQEPSILVPLETTPPLVHEAEGQILNDLAIIAGACYQQNVELTQGGYVPKRTANKIFPLLHGSRPDAYGDGDHYLDILFRTAQQLGLLQLAEIGGQKPRFMPGQDLAEWTTMDTTRQVQRWLELWWATGNFFWVDLAGEHFRPYEFGYYIDMRAARKSLTGYLAATCQPEQWYTLEAFLTNVKELKPQLLHPRGEHSAFDYGNVRSRKNALEFWDQTDGEIITGLLASTLHELGLVSLGYIESPSPELLGFNPYAFKLTDLAARVWQETGGTVVSASPLPERSLIVQPNFELLLLQPDYPTLYQLLPFARVDQIEMVSRLTLTKESVRRGVEAGWSVERILQILQRLSQKDLPQNVLYTLQDWSRFYKAATISQVILLELSSETAADEICGSARLRNLELRRLGPLAVLVEGHVSLQVLRSTLEKEGVIAHIHGEILNARDFSSPSYGRSR